MKTLRDYHFLRLIIVMMFIWMVKSSTTQRDSLLKKLPHRQKGTQSLSTNNFVLEFSKKNVKVSGLPAEDK